MNAKNRTDRWLERTLVPFRLTFIPSWVKLDDLDPEPTPEPPPEPTSLEGHRCLRPELPRAA